MPAIEQRVADLGLTLPELFGGPPGFTRTFDLVHVDRDIAYISGHGPLDGSTLLAKGKVGSDLTLEEGYEAARRTGLSMLASLRHELGSLDRIASWNKALGLVNCAPGFNATPPVIDGFTDLILELWDDAGRHARSAIGVAELPFDIPVEIEAVVRIA